MSSFLILFPFFVGIFGGIGGWLNEYKTLKANKDLQYGLASHLFYGLAMSLLWTFALKAGAFDFFQPDPDKARYASYGLILLSAPVGKLVWRAVYNKYIAPRFNGQKVEGSDAV